MIYIGIPTSGDMRAECVLSLLKASQEMRMAGVKHAIGLVIGLSPISLARAEMISVFMSCEEATHLLCIDDDMTFSASDILSLRAAEKPVVGAMCPMKTAKVSYCVMPSNNPVVDGDCVSVSAVGTGFMMIERGVIEALIEVTPEIEVMPGVKRWPLFEASLVNGEYISEDYTFCAKARALGFGVWAHTAVDIGHVGTHTYRGRHTASQKVGLLKGGWSE